MDCDWDQGIVGNLAVNLPAWPQLEARTVTVETVERDDGETSFTTKEPQTVDTKKTSSVAGTVSDTKPGTKPLCGARILSSGIVKKKKNTEDLVASQFKTTRAG